MSTLQALNLISAISVWPGRAPAGFVDKEKYWDIAKTQIKICDAVIKEEGRGYGGHIK
ncbi:hypothetical protein SAMN05216343_11121 [Oscillibacter sp. PC13]|nr:hypothetical protein SAMN05216343_11121 [Oscillibacter sp. PC13]